MRDITLEDTFYHDFSTRAFGTGIPTTLAGTPVLSVLEENNATPITAGVSVSVDRASVAGLNMATIVATAANGYENDKGYSVYISTGTVGGVSVVGEKVGEFTIGKLLKPTTAGRKLDVTATGAAGIDWANIENPTTAVDLSGTDIQLVDTTTTNTDMRGTDSAGTAAELAKVPKSDSTVTWNATALGSINAECDTALADYDGPTNAEMEARTLVAASYFDPAADTVANVTLVATTTTNTDMRGTDGANTVVPDAAGVAATPAEVNAEVLDVLTVDTFAEPGQGAPAATTTILGRLQYLYKAWRNQSEQTATTSSLYNDAGSVVDQKATVSDDGTTFTKGEQGTGP